LSIILAIVFVLSANVLSKRSLFESYDNLGMYYTDENKYTNLLGQPALIGTIPLTESTTEIAPGCMNVTVDDLLALFDNNPKILQDTLQHSVRETLNSLPHDSDAHKNLVFLSQAVGLPFNVEINDKTAPYLATLLLQYGGKVTSSCQPPN
jgi:hypothetical protein